MGHVRGPCDRSVEWGHTARFTDSQGRIIPHSIAAMERVPIGDLHQSVWFRGISGSNPVLILLHGGPGANEAPLFGYV